MSKGSGRRVSQVSIAQLDANWEAVFGKKDSPSDIECKVVDQPRTDIPMTGNKAVESFKALEGMGGCIVEGPTINLVCEYIRELEAKVKNL